MVVLIHCDLRSSRDPEDHTVLPGKGLENWHFRLVLLWLTLWPRGV